MLQYIPPLFLPRLVMALTAGDRKRSGQGIGTNHLT